MNFDYRRKVMECVESALKGSFRKEMSLKLNHQAVEDELLNASLASGDDFSVDDLLDFSEMTGADGEECHLDEAPKTCAEPTVPAASVAEHGGGGEMVKPEICRNFSLKEEELVVPADDVADLEWLSHFVEDSFSGYTLTCPPLPAKPVATPPMLPVEASGKPTGVRSKRPRNGVLGWSVSVSETSSSASSSSSTSFSSASTWLICSNHSDATPYAAASKKRNSKPPRVGTSLNGNRATTPRRCSHCGVQKTPQWRAGPLGAKTLCNACGVRFKSGRLLPEYRPACSPTFSSELHSNHHRKVLEMRHKKEVDLPETGHAPAVPSF